VILVKPSMSMIERKEREINHIMRSTTEDMTSIQTLQSTRMRLTIVLKLAKERLKLGNLGVVLENLCHTHGVLDLKGSPVLIPVDNMAVSESFRVVQEAVKFQREGLHG
jgi:hypothetical protein